MKIKKITLTSPLKLRPSGEFDITDGVIRVADDSAPGERTFSLRALIEERDELFRRVYGRAP